MFLQSVCWLDGHISHLFEPIGVFAVSLVGWTATFFTFLEPAGVGGVCAGGV